MSGGKPPGGFIARLSPCSGMIQVKGAVWMGLQFFVRIG